MRRVHRKITPVKRKFLKAFVTIAMVVSVHIPFAAAATYYLSSSQGNDSNDGLSEQAPWKSLEKITKKGFSKVKFAPGDNILLKADDTWYGSIVLWYSSGTAAAPITIGRYGTGANPIIYGDYATAIWSAVPGHPGVYSTYTGATTIWGTILEGTTQYKRIGPGSIPWWEGGSALDDYLNLLVPGSHINQTHDTAYIKTLDGNSPTNIRVFVHSVISLMGNYVIIENLSIQRSSVGIDISQSDHVIIRNNLIQDTLNIAIYLRWGNTNCLVENNTARRLGNTALYILTGRNNTFRGNTVDTVSRTVLGIYVGLTDSCGIGLQSSINNLIENNSVSHVRGSGVDYWYETGSVVRNNYFFQNGGGAYPHGTGLLLHGNIFNNDGAGPGTNSGHAYDPVESSAPDAGPVLIYNNVYYKTVSYGIMGGGVTYRNNVVISSRSTNLTLFSPGVDSDYNCYYTFDGTPRFNWNSKGYSSLEQYQSASGLDSHSIYADPQFVSDNPIAAADFKLKSTSPSLNVGLDLKTAGLLSAAQRTVDYVGTPIPQGIGVDMGAYEYVSDSVGEAGVGAVGGIRFENFKNVFFPHKDGSLRILFSLEQTDHVEGKIFDRFGQEIRKVDLGDLPALTHEWLWDGLSQSGTKVAAGAYLVTLKTSQSNISRKFVVVK